MEYYYSVLVHVHVHGYVDESLMLFWWDVTSSGMMTMTTVTMIMQYDDR